jgi:hypothetical protein
MPVWHSEQLKAELPDAGYAALNKAGYSDAAKEMPRVPITKHTASNIMISLFFILPPYFLKFDFTLSVRSFPV